MRNDKCMCVFVMSEYFRLHVIAGPSIKKYFSFGIYISIWKCKCKIHWVRYVRIIHTFGHNSIRFNPLEIIFECFFQGIQSINCECERIGGILNGHCVRKLLGSWKLIWEIRFDWYFIDGTCFTHLHTTFCVWYEMDILIE